VLRDNATEDLIMQYLLMLYANENGWETMPAAEQSQGLAAYKAYTEALQAAKVYVGGNRLRPVSDATTVTSQSGKSLVLDGPYAEAKEQLGGYYLIDVPNLDAAIAWANRCPGSSHGTIEVRPVWEMQD
jgi:hypothetical protein